MTNYTWKITKLYTKKVENKENYIVNVHFDIIGEDGTNNFKISNTITFDVVENTNFVPYEELTNDVVVQWIKSIYGEDRIKFYEDAIQKRLDILATPIEITIPVLTPLPWEN